MGIIMSKEKDYVDEFVDGIKKVAAEAESEPGLINALIFFLQGIDEHNTIKRSQFEKSGRWEELETALKTIWKNIERDYSKLAETYHCSLEKVYDDAREVPSYVEGRNFGCPGTMNPLEEQAIQLDWFDGSHPRENSDRIARALQSYQVLKMFDDFSSNRDIDVDQYLKLTIHARIMLNKIIDRQTGHQEEEDAAQELLKIITPHMEKGLDLSRLPYNKNNHGQGDVKLTNADVIEHYQGILHKSEVLSTQGDEVLYPLVENLEEHKEEKVEAMGNHDGIGDCCTIL